MINYCYFCKEEGGNMHTGPRRYDCWTCQDLNKLLAVITTDGFAHIYYNSWHIRLELATERTVLLYHLKTVCWLPGFPINPTNAKQKLKTIITFQ
jgi:hypothetical protein